MGRPRKIQPMTVQVQTQAKQSPDIFEVAAGLRFIGNKLGFPDGSKEGFDAAVKVAELCYGRTAA